MPLNQLQVADADHCRWRASRKPQGERDHRVLFAPGDEKNLGRAVTAKSQSRLRVGTPASAISTDRCGIRAEFVWSAGMILRNSVSERERVRQRTPYAEGV